MYIYLEFSVYRESMCTHFYVNKKNLLNLSHEFRVFFKDYSCFFSSQVFIVCAHTCVRLHVCICVCVCAHDIN